MKGWYMPVPKVLLYAFGAAVSALCLAFGIGLLLASPAAASTQAPAGLGNSLVSAVSGTVSDAAGAVADTVGTVTSAVPQTVSTASGAAARGPSPASTA